VFRILKNQISNLISNFQPFHNVAITNSSFPPSTPSENPLKVQTTSAYLFPSFKYIPFLPRVSFDSVQALAKGYILPTKLHEAHSTLSPIHRDRLLRSSEFKSLLYGVQDVDDIVILICGHGERDARCGIMGPILQEEFMKALPRSGIEVLQGPVPIPGGPNGDDEVINTFTKKSKTARVGQISHIGGHKFAGNVIIYIPTTAESATGETHPLAGFGIWYGRVEPKHVEGIVNETVILGNVISDHYRGGIKQGGEILRI
jgi:hypothetical protein